MDAASVWVEYLRERAVYAQREAAKWASAARRCLDDMRAGCIEHVWYAPDAEYCQKHAHRAGIIAREAYRQWAAAVIVLAQDAGTEDPERHGWRVGVMSDVLGCIEDDEP